MKRPSEPKTYGERDALLRRLGFRSYSAYLLDEVWLTIRSRVSSSPRGAACGLCGGKPDCLHHTSYAEDVLTGLRDDAIVPLCNGCHFKVEFTRDGAKRTMTDARVTYDRLKARKSGTRLSGRCHACGNKARKNFLLCRPCQKRPHDPIVREFLRLFRL